METPPSKVFVLHGDMCSPQAFSTFDKAKAHMDLILKVLKARVIDSTFWEKDMNVKLPHDIRYSCFLSIPGQPYQHQIFIHELEVE